MDKKDYTVKIAGFVLGDFHKEEATITLNERQARDLVREGRLVEKTTARSVAKADRKS